MKTVNYLKTILCLCFWGSLFLISCDKEDNPEANLLIGQWHVKERHEIINDQYGQALKIDEGEYYKFDKKNFFHYPGLLIDGVFNERKYSYSPEDKIIQIKKDYENGYETKKIIDLKPQELVLEEDYYCNNNITKVHVRLEKIFSEH